MLTRIAIRNIERALRLIRLDKHSDSTIYYAVKKLPVSRLPDHVKELRKELLNILERDINPRHYRRKEITGLFLLLLARSGLLRLEVGEQS